MGYLPRLWVLVGGLAGCALAGCGPAPAGQEPGNRFATDTLLRAVYDHQDHRRTDALLTWLRHPGARYRQQAALALASVQDPAARQPLLARLGDADAGVRSAAAFALGLTPGTLPPTLVRALHTDTVPAVRAALWEAWGRLANDPAPWLAAHPPPGPERTGWAWAVYRLGLRHPLPAAVRHRTAGLLTDPDAGVRLAAAHVLQRSRTSDWTDQAAAVVAALRAERDPEVLTALLAACPGLRSARCDERLRTALRHPDARVRVGAVRAAAPALRADHGAWLAPLRAALADTCAAVAVAAAEVWRQQALVADTSWLDAATAAARTDRVRALLWAARLRVAPTAALRTVVLRRFDAVDRPTEAALLLDALAEDAGTFGFIRRAIFEYEGSVAAAALAALVRLRTHPALPAHLHNDYAGAVRRAVASHDPALISLAALAMGDTTLPPPNPFAGDTLLLRAALRRLVLPRDVESYHDVQRTLNQLKREHVPLTPPPFTHPINWARLADVPGNQRVVVTTARGAFTLQLLPNEAPATVAYFLELVDAGFYEGMLFHRVVPNFVTQGGSPRGDGWGGTEVTIRSELTPRPYRTGSVGMASAGRDTESCQWFVTHLPTPHLEGRYTQFAVVVAGQEVVESLRQGDHLLKLKRLD